MEAMTYLPSSLRPIPAVPARRRRRRHPVAQLRPFSWWDLATVLTYIALMLLGLSVLILFLPPLRPLVTQNQEVALYLANLFAYVVCFVLVLFAVGRELWSSFTTFRWYPWAKYLGLPGSWVVTLIVTAIVAFIAAAAQGLSLDQIENSENQVQVEEMQAAVPFALMAFMVVLMGPLVEEYLFRHLLVGKLSGLLARRAPSVARWLNPWVLMVVSSLLFMSLHFVGKEWPTLSTGAPYVLMGLSFGTGYLLSGRSLAYSWCMHAFSNLMALVFTYAASSHLSIGA